MKTPETESKPTLMTIMKAAVDKVNQETSDNEEALVWPEKIERPCASALENAISIAVRAHQGQVDKAGASYILHPLRVMFQMKNEDEMIAAVLHDVVEDTNVTLEDLEKKGFERSVLEAIASVTRREGETYEDFVIRAGLHPIGAKIKAADISDNMDLNRIVSLSQKDLDRVQKYHSSLAVLKHLGEIRSAPKEVDFYERGGGVRAAKVVLAPKGISYPGALNTYGSAGTLIIDFDGRVSEAVMPEDFMTLRKILEQHDPAMLYGFHPFWALFFCPECQESYCLESWDMGSDGYGSCPKGHRRKMEG